MKLIEKLICFRHDICRARNKCDTLGECQIFCLLKVETSSVLIHVRMYLKIPL